MPDDKKFTVQEIKNVVAIMGHTAPGEDGITSEIYNSVVESFPGT
jgi:hypothetical protein